MNSVDFFIVLGELIFGRINNDSAKAGDVRFEPLCESPGGEILSGNQYDSGVQVFKAAAMLVPEPCRKHLAVIRREAGKADRREEWGATYFG